MDIVLANVKSAVHNELLRASKTHGATNNSPHESYAIILEEFEEACEDTGSFDEALRDFWKHVKSNDTTAQYRILSTMQDLAETAAAEWIQVAAMCEKAMRQRED